jgi:hypothetical protein
MICVVPVVAVTVAYLALFLSMAWRASKLSRLLTMSATHNAGLLHTIHAEAPDPPRHTRVVTPDGGFVPVDCVYAGVWYGMPLWEISTTLPPGLIVREVQADPGPLPGRIVHGKMPFVGAVPYGGSS